MDEKVDYLYIIITIIIILKVIFVILAEKKSLTSLFGLQKKRKKTGIHFKQFKNLV